MRGSDEVANKTFAIRSFQKNSRIKLYNFTDSYLKRAFGRNS